MEFGDLTNEQKTRTKACKTVEELVAPAEAEGVELSDKQLESMQEAVAFSAPLSQAARIMKS